MQQKRNVNKFFHKPGRWVISAAVLEEFLAVVGGERENAVVPKPQSTKGIDQPLHLSIYPAYTGVVECNYVIEVPAEAIRADISPLPHSIQKPCSSWRKSIIA
jgi:hypothetical protein